MNMSENKVVVDLEEMGNSCFVVMPFHSLFESEYNRVIRPAIEEVGLNCVRGDEIYTKQAIIQDIWKSIRQARIIVAELSGRNPNVMYEIGLAHAIGKPIILLTRNQDDVPFDLRALRYLYYDPNNPFWGKDLQVGLSKLIRQVMESSSIGAHLGGIRIDAVFPDPPEEPISTTQEAENNYGGVWNTSWISIKREREHKAILVIPENHGTNFTTSMTVTYLRNDQQTVVQETLTGSVRGKEISLTGVNYTYLEQGSSVSYSLDSFELRPSSDGVALIGTAVLRHGKREVKFVRLSNQ